MKKQEILKVAGWVGMVILVIAAVFTVDFSGYILQMLFVGAVLLHAYKKIQIRTAIIVGSILLLVVRVFGYTEAYDLIDIGIWGTILYAIL